MKSHREARRLRVMLASMVAMLFVLVGANAWGQGSDLQQFQPMPDQSRNFLSSSSAMVPSHLEWQGIVMLNEGNAPLVLENEAGVRTPVVGSSTTMHLMGSVGLFEMAELGVDLPLVVQQSSGDVALERIDLEEAGVGMGDLRVVPKIQVFSTRSVEQDSGMALAVVTDIYLPTGDANHLQGGEFRGGIRLAYDMVLDGGTRWAVNAGYLLRPTREMAGLEVGDALSWAVAGEVPLSVLAAPSDLRLIGELAGRVGVGVEARTVAQAPVEAMVAARYQYDSFFAQLGGGVGLVSGYGTPRMRGLFSVGFVSDMWHSAAPMEPTPSDVVRETETEQEAAEGGDVEE